ncbi:MAG: trypsin-like peptidase domain-containing protein [Candidatus Nealsonbacteria bacterium]|nr:trypsin-like peptidase domain-containing protein [Candidatus Nealsonbacteria bacterium]
MFRKSLASGVGVALLLAFSSGGRLSGQESEPEEVVAGVFTRLTTDALVTTMGVSEDGLVLFLAHQEKNLVTIWDVKTAKQIKSLDVPGPTCLMHRAGKLFVGTASEGSIQVYTQASGWGLEDELQIGAPMATRITAPRGAHFQGKIIVNARDGKESPGYVVDVNEDSHIKTFSRSATNADAVGRYAVLTGSGRENTIHGADLPNLLEGKGTEMGTHGCSGNVVAGYFGKYWFGHHEVRAGMPPAVINGKESGIVIPDLKRKMFYVLGDGKLTCGLLRTGLPSTGSQPASLPKSYQGGRCYSMAGSHPVAVTLGQRLYIYLWDEKSKEVFHHQFAAFGESPIAKPAEAEPPAEENPAEEDAIVARGVEGQRLTHALFDDDAARTCTLMSGPKGLTLSSSGVVSWTPSTGEAGTYQLKVKIVADGKTSIDRFTIEIIDKQLATDAGGDLSKIEQYVGVDLLQDNGRLQWSLDGKSLLLLQGRSLETLSADAKTIVQSQRLPHFCSHLLERSDRYVAVSGMELLLLDKKTLQVTKRVDFSKYRRIRGVALNPVRSVTYVSVENSVDKIRDNSLEEQHIMQVDERTGEITELPGVFGCFLAVDPNGRHLYAGFKDIYTRGSHFHINPGWRLLEVPDYGSIDILLRYSLRGGEVELEQLLEEAGGNGSGIVLSPDGTHISYLSYVGYPPFAGNVVALPVMDFENEKESITYSMKGVASCTSMAYHPMLNLVASPGGGSAVLFDRRTGKIAEDRLKLTSKGLGEAQVHGIMFSADGKHLVFTLSEQGRPRFLRAVPLNLTATELTTVRGGIRRPPAVVTDVTPGIKPITKVALNRLNSLQGGPGKAMSAKDIGRWFTDSVVVVHSDEGTGTGFVVGSSGCVVTCSHCLPESGGITVSYRRHSADRVVLQSTDARLLYFDAEKDLALLEVKLPDTIRSVRFATGGKVESGEHVTIIGNPGLGAAILDHTMTEGIVSNPRRDLGGQTFIQTSASVNPGSSGGPMFNSRGLVIGMVAVKGRIEGAGFAVPSDDIVAFLLAGAKREGADGALLRQWVDAGGAHTINARYGGTVSDKLRLLKTGDQEIQVPLSRLSKADQAFVQLLVGNDYPNPLAGPGSPLPSLPVPKDEPRERVPTAPPRSNVSKEALTWLEQNDTQGPESKMVLQVSKQIADCVAKGGHFTVKLGSRLLKSGKTTFLAGQHGKFFVFELPREFADNAGTPEMAAGMLGGAPDEAQPRTPRIELFDLKIDGAADLDVKGTITGTVSYRNSSGGGGSGKFALRFTAQHFRLYHHLGSSFPAGKGKFTFTFPADLLAETPGTQVAFIDLCEFVNGEPRGDVDVVSTTDATLIDVAK